jgi:hypothetical protein
MRTAAEQRSEALGRANVVRLQRAADRREIATASYPDGLRLLAAVLAGDDRPYFHRIVLFDFLQWPHGMGPERANQILRMADVSGTRPVSRLSRRQREAISESLLTFAYDADRRRAA